MAAPGLCGICFDLALRLTSNFGGLGSVGRVPRRTVLFLVAAGLSDLHGNLGLTSSVRCNPIGFLSKGGISLDNEWRYLCTYAVDGYNEFCRGKLETCGTIVCECVYVSVDATTLFFARG